MQEWEQGLVCWGEYAQHEAALWHLLKSGRHLPLAQAIVAPCPSSPVIELVILIIPFGHCGVFIFHSLPHFFFKNGLLKATPLFQPSHIVGNLIYLLFFLKKGKRKK